MKRVVVALGVGALTGVAQLVLLTPAKADPLCLDVRIERTGTTPVHVLGPNNCTSTPWTTFVGGSNSHDESGLPPGTPKGWYIFFNVPLPPS